MVKGDVCTMLAKGMGIGLSVFGNRNQAKDHGLRPVQRTAYPWLRTRPNL